MTSDNTPSGLVLKSADYGGSYPVYKAFDGNTATYGLFTSATSASNQYLGYRFNNAVNLTNAIIDYTGIPIASVTYKLQASNDGNTWDDLTESTTITEAKSYNVNISTSTKYQYARMFMSSIVMQGVGSTATPSTIQFYGYE